MRTICLPALALFALTAATVTAQTSAPVEPPAQIAVSPSRFEVEIGPRPTTESLRLFNFGDRTIEVQVSAASWDLDENNRVRHLEPDEQSLENWLILNPLRFTVEPGKSQAVRFSIRPRVEPDPGEHRAMVYFTEVLPEDTEQSAMRIAFRLGVAVYAFASDTVRSGSLDRVTIESGSRTTDIGFHITSTGNAHIRLIGRMGVWHADAYRSPGSMPLLDARGAPPEELPEGLVRLQALPTTPVLAGSTRISGGAVPTPDPGEYVLEVAAELVGTTIAVAERFSVPEPPAPRPTPADATDGADAEAGSDAGR